MDTDFIDREISARGWEVPAFRVEAFAGKQSKHVIVIPVVNEGERIQRQLRDICALGITSEIDTVVVDGGSTDGSLDPKLLEELNLRALLVKVGPGKLSAQLRCAYAWAILEGYEGIVTIDGNGKDGIEAIPAFVAALVEGYGYVQASRFLKGGRSENTPLGRLLAIRLIHAPILSLAARRWFTDTTQGYRAYSCAYLLDEGTQPFRRIFDRYELLAYLTVRACQLGYRVTEIATSRVYPADEAVPTKISGVKGLFDLLMVVVRTLFRVYHPSLKRGHP
jgi:glycosyltransferase involved in cell wall biosynthesis